MLSSACSVAVSQASDLALLVGIFSEIDGPLDFNETMSTNKVLNVVQ